MHVPARDRQHKSEKGFETRYFFDVSGRKAWEAIFVISELFGGWCLPFLWAENIGFYSVVVLLTYRKLHLATWRKLNKYQCFARHWYKNTVNTVTFAAGNKKLVNTMFFGFRNTKNVGIYSVVLL